MNSGTFTPSQLREAARKHEKIAQTFFQLADMVEAGEDLSAHFGLRPSAVSLIDKRQQGAKRKRAVYDDLEIAGPSTAKEISQRTGIPLATIYFVCKDTKVFRKKGKKLQLVKQPSAIS